MPTVAVEGVGALASPVPPTATVYHSKVYPEGAVAVNGEAVSVAQ